VIILLLPHLTILLMSFVKDGTWTWQVLPPQYTLENYTGLARAFAEFQSSLFHAPIAIFPDRPPRVPRLLQPVVSSLWMSTLATAGNFFFGLLVAYLLAKRKFRGKAAVDVLAMLPWALPGTVIAMNLLVVFNQPTWLAGGRILAGTVWLLPLAYFIRHIPLVVRSTHAALEQLDDSLEEAARSLGATWFYAFRRVTLPLVLPGVLAGTLLAYVSALGEFVSSIMLYTVHNRPISIEILAKLRDFHFGSAAAYSVLLTGLIAGALWFSSKVLKVRESVVV
jgi:iron(III) transport system permease protein